ncbi:MAG TPA: hypothetical protein ENO23_05555 [Alphaproteobacteria bacterium]|nr:hypothetical protein [Alphaproteobacteria bacterium]
MQAQGPGIDIRLNPRIGLYTPLTSLGEVGTETFELDNSLAVGLGIELDIAALPFGIRANMDYATSSSVDLEEGSINETNETTLLAVAGDLVFRPLPRLAVLQPYLFGGAGLKQYDFSWEDTSREEFEDASDFALHVGGGLDFGLGPLALNAEVGDYISWFEPEGAEDSEMQHDLFLMLGFSIGMF